MILVDKELATRLEQTEGRASARFVEARKRQSANSPSTWIEVAGAFVIYDGPDSPLTQSFGLGMHRDVTAEDLELIESFYRERNAPVFLEVSPLAPIELVIRLNERGYRPMEYTNVLCRSIGSNLNLPSNSSPKIDVRTIDTSESEIWAMCSARGWSDDPEFRELIREFGLTFAHSDGFNCMLAEIDGNPIATGVVFIADQTALLAGASTVPEARCQGAQLALLGARLSQAVNQKCDLAMMCALPGSVSQKNAQRNGFQIAYTRTKWRLHR